MPGPRAVPIVLCEADRMHLEKTVRQQTAPQRMGLRSRIILLAADGLGHSAIVAQLRCGRVTVVRWRSRFAEHGLVGLQDEPRPGRPRSSSPAAAPWSGGPGLQITTADINASLMPDVACSVEAIPFADQASVLVVAGEVLEHLQSHSPSEVLFTG